ncbi:hypothetical protein JTB14_038207 [Gonioctena quinquepunctata]|nr:hypothetical protein JTB14_038207 [Gonioctena quinquepunctata]
MTFVHVNLKMEHWKLAANLVSCYECAKIDQNATTAPGRIRRERIKMSTPVSETVTASPRSPHRIRLSDYEAVDEPPTDPEEWFEINVFYPMIDTIESALITQFERLSKFNGTWSFLYNIKKILKGPYWKKPVLICKSVQQMR